MKWTPRLIAALSFALMLPARADEPANQKEIAARTVDSVTAGDEQSERDHKQQGDKTETRKLKDSVVRFAETNGWFSWDLKVVTNKAQDLVVTFSGDGSDRVAVDILVNGAKFAVEPPTNAVMQGSGPTGPIVRTYPLIARMIRRDKLTVKFQASDSAKTPGVASVRLLTRPPTIASMSKVSSTRETYGWIAEAMNDQIDPTSSAVGTDIKQHFDWWPLKATNSWVQYDFAKSAKVSAVEVYWYDDSGRRGGCKPPKSWRLLYRKNGEWTPVSNPSGYGCEDDKYNRTTFDAVETDGLRLDVTMPDTFSSGVLQWKVE